MKHFLLVLKRDIAITAKIVYAKTIFNIKKQTSKFNVKLAITPFIFMISICSLNIAYSQCESNSQFPSNTINTIYGYNLISTNQWAGDYNVTSGYVPGDLCFFSSSNSSDFIVLWNTANNTVIQYGYGTTILLYLESYDNIEMHLFTDSFCATENVNRTTTVQRMVGQLCDNTSQFPPNTVTVHPGSNIIASDQYAGEYNLTTGYQHLDTLYFNTNLGDWITIRKHSTNEILIAGEFPIFVYNSSMGDLEMHVNKDYNCVIEYEPRASQIYVARVACNFTTRSPIKNINVNAGYNLLSNTQYYKTFNISTGYKQYDKCIFSSSNPTDHITLRKASDNSLILSGISPVNITYETSMGQIEMHLNEDVDCESFPTGKCSKTSVVVEKPCKAEDLHSQSPISPICGSHIVPQMTSNQYIIVSNLNDGEKIEFNALGDDPFVQIRSAINDSLLLFGTNPLILDYQSIYGNLKVSIGKLSNCSGGKESSLQISRCGCINEYYLNDPDIMPISCGLNNYVDFYPGTYIKTNGYIPFSTVTISSNVSTDYISVRGHNGLIKSGVGNVTFNYNDIDGDIDIHLNSDAACGYINDASNLTIEEKCPCFNSIAHNAFPIILQCNENIINSVNIGTHVKTTGYESGNHLRFSTDVSTDVITLISTMDGNVVKMGTAPLDLIYHEYWQDLQVHINSDIDCNNLGSPRVLNILRQCNCFDFNPIGLKDMCTITDSFYVENYSYYHDTPVSIVLNGSSPNTYFTVYKDKSYEVITSGIGTVNFEYNPMDTIRIHANENGDCLSNPTNPIIYITKTPDCADTDNDGVDDIIDNCPTISNEQQIDTDNDGKGDVCDVEILSTNNIGIGTENPKTKLHVKGGNIFVDKEQAGVIMKSANGRCWQLKINNDGSVNTIGVECPIED